MIDTALREKIKRLPGVYKAYQTTKSIFLNLRNVVRKHLAWRLRSAYASVPVKKLHIGCGANVLPGWLNADYFPHDARAMHIDATKRFPLKTGTFDYVFSEHMIEHISYPEGLFMLGECWRILKPGGKIRISTPNLQFLFDLYAVEKSPLQADYIKWAGREFMDREDATEVMVINNFFRAWGHCFIYDEKTLRQALEAAGFVNVVSFAINMSDDPSLARLEHERRMPEGFLQLESITLEARKA
jgi:predicted SAM-dependent methyltransferase